MGTFWVLLGRGGRKERRRTYRSRAQRASRDRTSLDRMKLREWDSVAWGSRRDHHLLKPRDDLQTKQKGGEEGEG